MHFFSHKSCLQLKGQNLLQEYITSSLMFVRVLPLFRGVSVGSVPQATGSRAACRLLERGCTRTWFLTPGLGSLHCQWREKGSWCLICLWSVCGHTHLVAVGGMSLILPWQRIGVPGPFLFVALCGAMGNCTWVLQKRGPPKAYTVVSPLNVSLLLFPFCFSCWWLWVLPHRRSWSWDVFSQVMFLNPLSFSTPNSS